MPSFDVVSKVDSHEVDNARNQASKEITQRYDFKGTDTSIEQTEEGIVIRANSEGRLLSLIHISEPTSLVHSSRMPSSA